MWLDNFMLGYSNITYRTTGANKNMMDDINQEHKQTETYFTTAKKV